MPNEFKDVIAQLEQRRAAIEKALAALREMDNAPQASQATKVASKAAAGPRKATAKRGGLTPEGRRRLALAMKRRWAAKRTASQAKKGVGGKAA